MGSQIGRLCWFNSSAYVKDETSFQVDSKNINEHRNTLKEVFEAAWQESQ
jgi:hypothetical protein